MPVPVTSEIESRWCVVDGGPVPLRCWWSLPELLRSDQPIAARVRNQEGSSAERCRAVLVLPEVFGVNAWVRDVAERLADQGIPALAIPLFARSAPDLDLDYSDIALAEGRRHKDRTTTPQILSDLSAAAAWL